MENIKIRRPRINDVHELTEFFRIVLFDTFTKEGIDHLLEDLEEEIKAKENYFMNDMNSDGKDRYFLIALKEDKIIGTIEHGITSELINTCTGNTYKGLQEVGTIFVHPNFQNRGIGNLLLSEMYMNLKSKGLTEFCLDSGYRTSQKIWTKKFGNPDYLLKDYWGKDFHHMIWRVQI
ncbi:GNAT family N-acetyltransferase [Bacillus suaedaesalsae]|uniref:GNAT family N-acetyltransferase n=1 Tax=Bacillus suaedaesalsae TaxID=2810349 RepID=A0ABS2DMN3_9BACI|nr:GNAT family N-acetyltransferase [Bacillus suaedaesalsae]MBM6619617.1 GNAT family N-acetyltransferase [Bacillus suaedaesalsae]